MSHAHRPLDLFATIGEQERRLIDLEHAWGMTPAGMVRPMFPWEYGTDFALIDNLLTTAQRATTAALQRLHDLIVNEIRQRLAAQQTLDQITRVINALVASQPKIVRDAIKSTKALIAGALADLYAGAAAGVKRDASRQGVAVSEIRDIEPTARQFDRPASIPPQSLWTKLLAAAVLLGGTRQPDATEVTNAVADTSIDGAIDLARQATNVASGQGRTDQVQEFPEQPDVYSSELLDGDTCDACGSNDGVDYPDLNTALEDYPDGPYKDCFGGDRCRGSLVFVFNEDSSTLDPNRN